MIKPHKYLDVDSSVIRVGSLILKEMLDNKIISYSELYNKIYNKVGKNVEYTFLPSLSFIYLFGKIKYYKESDTLELIL
ncbi:ABC-three component system middle component 8 [Clostridium tyrobutyricum]|uniref:ABC-three component system middle component 8 n=1 Tax=Clostridium tyrobutyricum TaxID=1519 RepID=UPI0011CB3DE9|nr:ABC-three component system middle component 8 [Clostridium tyrobutyricum]